MAKFSLAFLSFLISGLSTVLACQYTSNQNELETALKDRVEMRRLVAELKQISDSLSIGAVDRISSNSVNFEDIVVLKGSTQAEQTYHWDSLPEKIIGCSGVVEFQYVELEDSDDLISYLVYVSGSQILRAKEIGSFAESIDGYEEVEWLRQ